MLKNSDELFSKPAFSASPNQGGMPGFYTNLFVFQPNLPGFETLSGMAETMGKNNYTNLK